ncbi:MAG: calcineurin-like phosphoesterase C-terminal domain-containing protein [Lunatimonas sp.]|uniref:calcineurin-like phosphoesterase C-terminal domain-containing protein n=1 Tax=Lunatimonas sp. TaxID=2060141 RepID=UPI00263AFDAA|nr:calcineurin-like phosphoesterase C-terminal domain-containing protein [Lunatimonas sp.]MCC5938463.1 calcineurin-like phosphoesterase C-terminal domain-containing protein [Lunatimonas sp.]
MQKIFSIFLIMLVWPAFSQQVATGYVYEDLNQNGKRDRREKGIANVSVSNGTDVVLTDGQGRYSLEVGEDNILFVIKPSGYSVPVNDANQPQFYYIHKPSGSPATKYQGVVPTGPLPKSVDFPLYAAEEPTNFTALIFGDSQPYTTQELAFFQKSVVEEAKNEKQAVFGLTLGDLVGDDLDLHQPYIHVMKAMGLPWYNLMGNHDMNLDVDRDEWSDESFEASFGPANYAFNYGGVHFIVLDDILYPDPRDGQGYWGGFRKDQLDFVQNNLRFVPQDKLVVLAFHIPLFHVDEISFRDSDRRRLFDLLKSYPNVLAMSAHTHLQRQNYYTAEDGWHGEKPFHEFNAGTTNGDWYSGKLDENNLPISTMRDGTPKGYTRLKIVDNSYQLEYQVLGKPADYQMHVFHPQVVANNRGTQAGIFVNFYMGHQDDQVEYRINGGDWRPLVWVDAADPVFVKEVMEWDTADQLMAGRRPSNPVNSTHLWRGSMPTNLGNGSHQIEVRATDRSGKVHTHRSTYRIAEPVAF